jgi:hypothetical protein
MSAAATIGAFIENLKLRFAFKGATHGRSRSTTGNSGGGPGHAALSVSGAGPIPVPAIHLPALPNTARSAEPSPGLIAAWRQAGYHGNLKYEELTLPELLRSTDKSVRIPSSTMRAEIVAYRVWRVFWEDSAGGSAAEPRMGSAHYGRIVWESGLPMVGEIDTERPQRRTGIHAYSDATHMIAGSIAPCLQAPGVIVVGTVSLWGKVIVYERGYRAQFAYPRKLCWTNGDPKLLHQLAAIYGCELHAPALQTPEAA